MDIICSDVQVFGFNKHLNYLLLIIYYCGAAVEVVLLL